MNQIVRTDTQPRNLIVALESEFAKKAMHVAWRLDCMKDCRFEQGDAVKQSIAEGDAMVASADFQILAAELKAALAPATVAQIKREIAALLAAFPTKDDLTAFVPIVIEEIAGEHPSRLALAAACRDVRRTCKFRPSIAEMLDALDEVRKRLRMVPMIVNLPGYVATLRQVLEQWREIADRDRLCLEASRIEKLRGRRAEDD